MNNQLDVVAYILAKNEEPNIEKCLRCLALCQIPVILLDSGSTDATKEIAARFSFCEVRDFKFTSHTDSWNLITGEWHRASEYIMILDADMEVSPPLWQEMIGCLARKPDVVLAPVRMYLDGRPLRHGSLYPPKAILFRGGATYFLPKGHCSRLRKGLKRIVTKELLIHNDLKLYSEYLLSQVRYGNLLFRRFTTGEISFKDWLRATTPLMALVFPVVSLFLRGGILAGRMGILYALDRAIAALIQYRVVLSSRMSEDCGRGGNEQERYTS